MPFMFQSWQSCFSTLTHLSEVGLVDLGDLVVASVEVSGLFRERGHVVQLQVVTVNRPTQTGTQQTGGHTWEAGGGEGGVKNKS